MPISSHSLLCERSTPLLTSAIPAQEAAATLSKPTKPVFGHFAQIFGSDAEEWNGRASHTPRSREAQPLVIVACRLCRDEGLEWHQSPLHARRSANLFRHQGSGRAVDGLPSRHGMGSDSRPVVAPELGDRGMGQLAVATTTKSDALLLALG